PCQRDRRAEIRSAPSDLFESGVTSPSSRRAINVAVVRKQSGWQDIGGVVGCRQNTEKPGRGEENAGGDGSRFYAVDLGDRAVGLEPLQQQHPLNFKSWNFKS